MFFLYTQMRACVNREEKHIQNRGCVDSKSIWAIISARERWVHKSWMCCECLPDASSFLRPTTNFKSRHSEPKGNSFTQQDRLHLISSLFIFFTIFEFLTSLINLHNSKKAHSFLHILINKFPQGKYILKPWLHEIKKISGLLYGRVKEKMKTKFWIFEKVYDLIDISYVLVMYLHRLNWIKTLFRGIMLGLFKKTSLLSVIRGKIWDLKKEESFTSSQVRFPLHHLDFQYSKIPT